MNKVTKSIGWANFTINPIKGKCPVACSYCYARRLYDRFKWNPEIRFEPKAMLDLPFAKKGERVFIGSTFELFYDSVPQEWLDWIFYFVKRCPWVTCIFLTKQPQNLAKWSPFPDNCCVGVSVTANGDMTLALTHLVNIKAGKRFISFEPLLGAIGMNDHMSMKGIVDWVILGQMTPYSPKTAPKVEWVEEIVEAADKAGVKVFLKDNLLPVLRNDQGWTPALFVSARDCSGNEWLRQEFPDKVAAITL